MEGAESIPLEITPRPAVRWEQGALELSQAQVAELSSIRLDLSASFSQHRQPGEAARGSFSPRSAPYFHWQEGVNSPPLPLPSTPQDRFHTVSRSAKKRGGNGEQQND